MIRKNSQVLGAVPIMDNTGLNTTKIFDALTTEDSGRVGSGMGANAGAARRRDRKLTNKKIDNHIKFSTFNAEYIARGN